VLHKDASTHLLITVNLHTNNGDNMDERKEILADYDLDKANIEAAYGMKIISYEECANALREARKRRDTRLQDLDNEGSSSNSRYPH
jgi:hypothetical protein